MYLKGKEWYNQAEEEIQNQVLQNLTGHITILVFIL